MVFTKADLTPSTPNFHTQSLQIHFIYFVDSLVGSLCLEIKVFSLLVQKIPKTCHLITLIRTKYSFRFNFLLCLLEFSVLNVSARAGEKPFC